MNLFTKNKIILLILLLVIPVCFSKEVQTESSSHVLPPLNVATLKQRIAQAAVVAPSQRGKSKLIKGSIEIDDHEDDIPEFRIYFNGMETLNSREGFFSFPFDEQLDEYKLILTKGVEYKAEKNNTLKELRIKDSRDYRCFTLRRSGADNTTWEWEENAVRSDNFIVPYKSIVLFVNPRCLKKLEAWKVQLPDNFITVPRLILKGKYRTWLDRQAKKSLLYSLDLKPFHEKVREEHKNIPGASGEMVLLR